MSPRTFAVFFSTLAVLCSTASLEAAPIDLRLFAADPSVTVAPDGGSASFAEDADLASVILSNDPSLGDPELIIAALDTALFFAYDFVEAENNVDEFLALLFDANSGAPIAEVFCDRSCSGSRTINLAPILGLTLGLEFQLNSIPPNDGIESRLTISNLELRDVVQTPEPALGAVFALALAALIRLRRFGSR